MKYVDEDGVETIVLQIKAYADARSELIAADNWYSEDEDGWGRSFLEELHCRNRDTVPEYGCYMQTNLRSVDLGEADSIEDHAFYGCSVLTDFTAESLEFIGDKALAGTAVKELDLPNVTTVSPGAFFNCESLATVRFGAGFADEEEAMLLFQLEQEAIESDEGGGPFDMSGLADLYLYCYPPLITGLDTSEAGWQEYFFSRTLFGAPGIHIPEKWESEYRESEFWSYYEAGFYIIEDE